jgi:hypothetical protein
LPEHHRWAVEVSAPQRDSFFFAIPAFARRIPVPARFRIANVMGIALLAKYQFIGIFSYVF